MRRIWACLLILMLIGGGGRVLARQATPPQDFIIVFYGAPDAPEALGLQVAIAQMAETSPVQAPNGLSYQVRAGITDEPERLSEADAIFLTPDAPPPPEALTLNAPLFLFQADPEAPLSVENIQGPYFRALTNRAILWQALADFAVVRNQAQRVVFLGDEAEVGAETLAVRTAFDLADVTGGLTLVSYPVALPDPTQLDEILAFNPQVVYYAGTGLVANQVKDLLASLGWTGVFVYEGALEAYQAGLWTPSEGIQTVGMTPWVYSAADDLSRAFREVYLTQTGRLPSARAVSAYDVAWAVRLMIQRVGADPATLAASLASTTPINTTQGVIHPAAYGGTDLFQSASLYALTPLGGATPLAVYDAGQVVSERSIAQADNGTAIGAGLGPTPTPSQATITVTSQTLNVRRGPGLAYDILTSLKQGDQVPVAGASADYTWFYVQTERGLGWVTAQFVNLFNPLGGVAGLQIIAAPPVPTPSFTATPAGTADLVISGVALNPSRPVLNQPFTATITIVNTGNADAGPFSIAATWNPGAVATSQDVPSLAAGASVQVVFSVTLTVIGAGTGNVTADSANTVTEGNETNNVFNAAFVVDAPLLQADTTTPPQAPIQFNFGGPQTDLDWTGAALNTLNNGKVGIISGISYNDAHAGLLTSTSITATTVSPLTAGTIFGLRTENGTGLCGIFRIDTIVGANITLTYRTYPAANCPP